MIEPTNVRTPEHDYLRKVILIVYIRYEGVLQDRREYLINLKWNKQHNLKTGSMLNL